MAATVGIRLMVYYRVEKRDAAEAVEVVSYSCRCGAGEEGLDDILPGRAHVIFAFLCSPNKVTCRHEDTLGEQSERRRGATTPRG